MPTAADADQFRAAGKAFCPTELGGMMGYLTAVEQYLAHLEGVKFDVGTLFDAAATLEEPVYRATRLMIDRKFALGFEQAVEELAKARA